MSPDFSALEREWRALEFAVPGHSFFQSWTWMGCLAQERFRDPLLLRARCADRTIGLALFNRRSAGLFLSESGEPEHDAPYIEHNAPLVNNTANPGLARAMLRAARLLPGVRRVVLSGVPPTLIGASGGFAVRLEYVAAPCVDLVALRASAGDFLATLSRNTRQQMRRSLRYYGAEQLKVCTPETVEEAQLWLDELMDLHTETWRRRGKSGAFATAFVRRFHQNLVARAFNAGALDLLRVQGREGLIGYLYNFRTAHTHYAYQSGFRFLSAAAVERPGLICHLLAIERAFAAGAERYDFLAGGSRYKASLANASQVLLWTELASYPSLRFLALKLKMWFRSLPFGCRPV